jgi:hypothetical protein
VTVEINLHGAKQFAESHRKQRGDQPKQQVSQMLAKLRLLKDTSLPKWTPDDIPARAGLVETDDEALKGIERPSLAACRSTFGPIQSAE